MYEVDPQSVAHATYYMYVGAKRQATPFIITWWERAALVYS